MESNNKRTRCADKNKQALSVYDITGEEKTKITSENKEKSWDGYVHIYECGKLFCTSTFERACAAQETTINKIKILWICKNMKYNK